MKRLLLAVAVTLTATSSFAAPLTEATLKAYAAQALPRCPGSNITLERIAEQGPMGFQTYGVTLRSSDEYCGTQKYMLVSPKTQQVLLGSIIVLPADARPVNVRAADQASQLLKRPVTAQVSPFPLPDGIKAVSLFRDTQYGPFPYHGFIDSSERFLIIGSRGNLGTPPAKTLRDSLGLENGVKRGTGKVEIIELSDFQCPTCARAHKALEPVIQKNLGKVNYIRIDLPLFEHHEWAIPAALGGRAIQKVAPAKYWSYVDYVFTNQEQIGKMKFDTVLKNWVEDNDLNWAAIEKVYRNKQEQQILMDGVARAFDLGVNSTPTFIVNGQILGYGPEGTFTINSVRQALGLAPEAAKPAAKQGTPKKK
ncbi:MAG TPA: thioredoxin domain-containing protein [Thermoanaerobaculia bacterium]|jgi:protein-disulfide isomerase